MWVTARLYNVQDFENSKNTYIYSFIIKIFEISKFLKYKYKL